MASPTRFTSGLTQAASYQPLGHYGCQDPFFYAEYADDFLHYNSGDYTVTATGGSVASTATNGIGGRILFTTGATASNFAEIQLPTAGFKYTAGKKLLYMARLQVAAASAVNVLAGLCNTTATPFAGITDGIYFSVTYGSPNISLIVMTGSVQQASITLPITLVNNTDIDLSFYVDRLGNIKATCGNNLEGVKRQNTAALGPNTAIASSAITPTGITAVQLTPTLAVSNGAGAVAQTMVSDFQFAAMER